MFTEGFVRTVKVHLRAGSRDCVDHAYANETLFVTVLRNPVDRYVSEYFYKPFYKYVDVGKRLKSESTKDKVAEWYARSLLDGPHIKMNKATGNFIENWQTRWYTNPNNCEDLNRPPPHDSHPNYSYWQSGQTNDPRNLITSTDLEDAKKVLDAFDIVGVAPFFGGECSITAWLELAGSNKRIGEDIDVRTNENKNKPSEADDIKTNITKYLADQVKYDIELFNFAVELSNRRKAISCCIKQHLQLWEYEK
jgi:hypothetical protein